MTLKFNPPKHVAKYALFVDYGNERGKFFTYDQLGSAKNASYHKGYNSDMKILENVDGDWYVLFEFNAGDTHRPWEKEVTPSYYSSYRNTRWTAVPMTRDEYAEWRIQVERERVASERINKFSVDSTPVLSTSNK